MRGAAIEPSPALREKAGSGSIEPDTLRLCRADRRAECRQIDAAEPARRPQAGDCHAESADDAHAAARHRARRRGAADPCRYARHLRAAPPARPRDGRGRLGRRRRCRPDRAAGRCGAPGRAGYAAHHRQAQGKRPPGGAGAQQGRSGPPRQAARHCRCAVPRRLLRRGVHDLRPDRRRGRGSETPSRRVDAAGSVAVSRGPAVRRAGALARRRGHARAGLSATA